MYSFIRQLDFDPEYNKVTEALCYEEWDQKRIGVIEDSVTKERDVADLLAEQKGVFDSIKRSGSDLVRSEREKEYEELEKKIVRARENRDVQVKKEIDVKLSFKYSRYFMEHFRELLIDQDNLLRQQQLFGMLFEELQTYDEVINGTVKLNLCF